MPRLTLYTPELAERIFERLSGGEALAAICADDDMPTSWSVLKWADKDPEGFGADYRSALEARAEWFLAEHQRIRITAVDRESAAAARVQLIALEWTMSKMAPTRYGDRVNVDVSHQFDLAALLDQRRQKMLDANETLGIPDRSAG